MRDKDYTFTWIVDRALLAAAVLMIFLFIEKGLDIWQQHVDQEESIALYNATDFQTISYLQQLLGYAKEQE